MKDSKFKKYLVPDLGDNKKICLCLQPIKFTNSLTKIKKSMNKKLNVFKMSSCVIIIALVSVLFSCNTSMDFAKRRYSSGYYVNFGGKHNDMKKNEIQLSFAKKAKGINHQTTQSIPETIAPTIVKKDVFSEVISPAIEDNTLTASTDATPIILAMKVDFTKRMNFPLANKNQTFVAENTTVKKDASSSKSSNHKGWYIFGGIATFFGALGLHHYAASMRPGVDNDKDWTIALLLCFFFGVLGFHRFYLGYTWQGIVQLCTAGGCGVWALIDLIRILMKDLKPIDGDYR